MGKLLRRLGYWFSSRRANAELAEEIELHRLMKQEQLEQAGLSAKEAGIASKRAMGNSLLACEKARDVWNWVWLDDAGRDLRHSLRDFRKAPGFWLGASLILSLGIGVNLAAFQLLDAVFWRPPQIQDPKSLVRLFRGQGESFPYPALAILEANNNVLSSVLVRSERARTNAANLSPLMIAAAHPLNDDVIPAAHLLSMEFANGGGDARIMSRLLFVLGMLALSITCVGIFGTVSFAAMLRRQEIGIRMALGAGQKSMILLLVRQLRWPLIGGLAFGLAASIPAAYTFSGVPLFVKPFDPPVMTAVAFFLTVTAALAAAWPAWRALRSSPLQSLRSEQ